MALADLVQYINAVLFPGLALLCVQQWRRRRSPAAAWLAVAFGVLGAIVLASLGLPEEPTHAWEHVAQRILIFGLVLYPYALFRFAAAFRSTPRVLNTAAIALTAALAVSALFFPSVPGEGDPRPLWFQLWVIAFLIQWVGLMIIVAVWLWRGSSGLATVARRRMRVLSIGATLFGIVLLPAAAPQGATGAVSTVTSLLPVLSAVLFYIGFAPPAFLRTLWRRTDQAGLRDLELDTMRVETPEAIARAVLPHIDAMLGGRGSMLLGRDGMPVAAHHLETRRANEIADEVRNCALADEGVTEVGDDIVALPLEAGVLVVQTSPYAPFFGAEEFGLLRGLGNFVDLIIQRASALAAEQAARIDQERTNAELETLVYGISHDLKSPLISLLGYLEYLEADYGPQLGDEGRHYVRRMNSSARYMQDLIGDLLELSRIGRIQTEPQAVNVGEVVSELVTHLGATHPNTTFTVRDLPVVWANPVRIRQLFTNLIENAIRHGGRDDLNVRVWGATRDDGSAVLSVADDGIGVPPAYREKVFGIFERLGKAEDERLGTGIGLALCKKIVDTMGGDISMVDAPVGAHVTVKLPAWVMRDRRADLVGSDRAGREDVTA